ncbi:hypothetical protein BD289DRAFT_502065 [Coniella lustricola]|uniref:Uncharacterized protein n=1 Tax=Coniella lustricola TaxID=2025994 RepID=A0A2T3AN54_9PEZI|nr:hypothetical protein BD289DRAFT_502065 [Coniella lustricola]
MMASGASSDAAWNSLSLSRTSQQHPEDVASASSRCSASSNNRLALCDRAVDSDGSSDDAMPLRKILVLLRQSKKAKHFISPQSKKPRSLTAMAAEASKRQHPHNADQMTICSKNSPLHAKLTAIALHGVTSSDASSNKTKHKPIAKHKSAAPHSTIDKPGKVNSPSGSLQNPSKQVESCAGQMKVSSTGKTGTNPLVPKQTITQHAPRTSLGNSTTFSSSHSSPKKTVKQGGPSIGRKTGSNAAETVTRSPTPKQSINQRVTPREAGASVSSKRKRLSDPSSTGKLDGGSLVDHQRKKPRGIAPDLRSVQLATSTGTVSGTKQEQKIGVNGLMSQKTSTGTVSAVVRQRKRSITGMTAQQTSTGTAPTTAEKQKKRIAAPALQKTSAGTAAATVKKQKKQKMTTTGWTHGTSNYTAPAIDKQQKTINTALAAQQASQQKSLTDKPVSTLAKDTIKQTALRQATMIGIASTKAVSIAPTASAAAAVPIVPAASIVKPISPEGGSQRPEDEADDVSIPYHEVEKLDRLLRNRLRNITKQIDREFPHKTEAEKGLLIREKYTRYWDKKQNELERKARGIAGKQLIKAPQRKKGEDTNQVNAVFPAAAAPAEPVIAAKAGVPAPEALQPSQRIIVYAVHVSGPTAQEPNCEASMIRTKVFGDLDAANHYAMQLLCGTPSQQAKKPPKQVDSWSVEYINRLFIGRTKRGDGTCVCVEVRKEQQTVGDLDPDILHNQYVDEGILHFYRKRYDVWEVQMIPRTWLDAEGEYDDKKLEEALDEPKEVAAQSRNETSPSTDNTEEAILESIEEVEEGKGLEGSDLRDALSRIPFKEAHFGDDDDDDDGAAAHAHASATANKAPPPINEPHADSSSHDVRRASTPRSLDTIDPYSDCEIQHILHGSFTDLSTANARAFAVARQSWKPRSSGIDDVMHWTQSVIPRINQEMETMDMDGECAEIVCPTGLLNNACSRRPWLFVHARVSVVETRIEGPMDAGLDFEFDMSPGAVRKRKRASRAVHRDVKQGSAVSAGASTATAVAAVDQNPVEVLQMRDSGGYGDLEQDLDLDSDSDEGEISEEE